MKLDSIYTHIHEIDNIIGGINKGELVLLASRPGVGKTTLALNIGSNAALIDKKSVVIFSLEMSKEQIVFNILSAHALIEKSRLKACNLKSDEKVRLENASSEIANASIKIEDTPSISLAQIASVLRREKEIDLVIIDYMQLVSSDSTHESYPNKVLEIIRSLKNMAKEFDTPIIILSQLSRAADMSTVEEMQSSKFGELEHIKEDTDIVMILHKDKDSEMGIVNLLVDKNRHGLVGVTKLRLNGEFSSYAII